MVVDVSDEGQETVTIVLCSGGLDSAVLVAHEAQAFLVQPIYLNAGLAWESVERVYLSRLLSAPTFATGVRPWIVLDCSVADVYPPTHWARRGAPPAYNTPDKDVYLVGRNVLLLSKAAVYGALNGIGRIAVGPLIGNPFPDASPEFFAGMARALSSGLNHKVEIVAPFSTLHKTDVIRLGTRLGVPWEHTVSCMNPVQGTHCGRCSKCRERLQAFDAAGLCDPADYVFRPDDVSTGI